MAILQKKAEDELLHVDGEVLEMIAERVASNIRELEGCLTRLVAYSSLTGSAPHRPGAGRGGAQGGFRPQRAAPCHLRRCDGGGGNLL